MQMSGRWAHWHVAKAAGICGPSDPAGRHDRHIKKGRRRMHTRSLLAATATAALLAAAAPLTAASAATHDVLTTSSPGGPNVTVGATVQASLKSGSKATFFSPGTTTGVTCTKGSETSKVTANPAKPGTATESLTAESFSHCTTNIGGATSVQSVKSLHLPYSSTISDSTGLPVKISKLAAQIAVGWLIGTITCSYKAAQMSGHASNTGQKVTFTRQKFTLSSGSSECPSSGDFSATFGPETDTNVSGSPHVYVN
jgi:hypothetical protein